MNVGAGGQPDEHRRASSTVAAAAEVVTLDEMGDSVLPALADAVGASETVVWRRTEHRDADIGAGTLAWCIPSYLEHAARDPQALATRGFRTPIVRLSRFVDREKFRDSEIYQECYRPIEVADVLSCGLTNDGYLEPGSTRVALFRSVDQRDFGPHEEQTLAAALPALRAAARRTERFEPLLRAEPVIETLLESLSPQPCLVLDCNGQILWISPRAQRILPTGPGGHVIVPDVLVETARRLNRHRESNAADQCLPTGMTVPGAGPMPLRVEPHIMRTPSAGRVLVVEVVDFSQPSLAVAELAARHDLTPAETTVLGALSLGVTNRAIAQRLSVSVATVNSHVSHILRKLDVRSRTDAIFLARRGSTHAEPHE